jgi:hypothetical protein
VNRRARQNKAPIPKPGQIATSVSSSRVFRFYGANQAAVTRGNMLGLLAMAITTGTLGGLISSIRIKHIKMWGVSGNAIQGIGLLWKGGQGRDIMLNDVSTSTAYPPYISSSPPPMSTASFWSSIDNASLSEVLFELNPTSEEGASPVCVVDVSVDIVLQSSGTTPNVISAGTSSWSPGTVYYGYLDGVSSPSYQPVGGLQYH